MKISFTKFKKTTEGLSFFWQALVIIFFVGLLILLIVGAFLWLNLESDINSKLPVSAGSPDQSLDPKNVNRVFDQIKTRSTELASTTSSSPAIPDPSH
ncbi:MAG: hypothetical protein WC385_03135 [Candidatus Paceibacterota bacterium]|jgi:preprotein translocase subunit SecF